MTTAPRFEELLSHRSDPRKEAMRSTLITILNSKAEILPSANSPRGKLWRLVNTPDSSLAECAEVIQLDSALAARIFRVANSGAFGGQGGQSDNVTDAVLRLGLKFVREQVFNAGVFKQFSGWVLPPEWDAFWLRNIFTARLCERLSGIYGQTNGSEYLAGLLHDMGWLFIATYFPNEFAQVFTGELPVNDGEKEFLPFGHAQISAAIAARSLLPERAVNAILFHHVPVLIDTGASAAAATNPYFLGIVLSLCDGIADAHGMAMFTSLGATLEELQESDSVKWLAKFGKTPELAAVAEEEMAKSQQIFEAYFSNRKFN